VIGSQLRPIVGKIVDPLVGRLAAMGVTPDVVTATGTVGVIAAALVFFPHGHFLVGTLVITLFVLTDTIDGALARKLDRVSLFGGWLDSTCDRLADGAVFGALAIYYASHSRDLFYVTLFTLITSQVISYEKARAEGVGLSCNVGIADRPTRLIVLLVCAGFTGLGVSYRLLEGGLWVLAVLTGVTVIQRMLEVRRQAGLHVS
jgi:CDP-diacylglycerol--glycerol-3-phosphate 3-phosphatidyltransferase